MDTLLAVITLQRPLLLKRQAGLSLKPVQMVADHAGCFDGQVGEQFGFAVKITDGTWLWSSIMDAIFDEIAPLALMDDDEFVKFWAK